MKTSFGSLILTNLLKNLIELTACFQKQGTILCYKRYPVRSIYFSIFSSHVSYLRNVNVPLFNVESLQ